MADPLVSVVMSVYNGLPYLEEAVESVLDQTFEDFEFIIINDGSTDGSKALLEALAASDERIGLVHQENQGLTKSLNRGLEMARGTRVARMDADDLAHPERFERQLQFLRTHPEVGMLGTRTEFIDEAGEVSGKWRVPVAQDAITWHLLFNTCICHSSLMADRAVLEKLGGYAKWATTAQDYELFTRAIFETQIANLPEVLLWKRRDDQNITAKRREEQIHVCCRSAATLHRALLGKHADSSLSCFLTWMEVEGVERAIYETKIKDYVGVYNYIYKLYAVFKERLAIEKRCIPARHKASAKLYRLTKRIAEAEGARIGVSCTLRALLMRPFSEVPLWFWKTTQGRIARRLGRPS